MNTTAAAAGTALLVAPALVGCSGDLPTTVESSREVAFTAVAAGGDHTCGLTDRNGAFCWGRNTHSQLGNSAADPTAESVPVPAAGALRFVELGAGGLHTCGLTDSGSVHCWGDDSAGQLGGGTQSAGGASAVPVSVVGDIDFVSVTLGGRHTCGLNASGRAYCWGDNQFGQLGNGSTVSVAEPVPVESGVIFSSLEAGVVHTCGLTASGTAYCWGYDRFGQLGELAPDERCGVSPCASVPVRIAAAPPLVSLVAGGLQSCGLTDQGVAYCWGANLSEELGSAEVSGLQSRRPVEVMASARFTAVTVGEHGACAISPDREAFCWGSNSHGQLGNGIQLAGAASSLPVRVSGELEFAEVSSGMFHTCGVTLQGAIHCWGANRFGQLGTGTTQRSSAPVPVVPPAPTND